ncbi:hypothetical protein Ae717Ps2_5829 [Pseudonocardia sp. Ae717_Ps2]|uniref:hypothetical protein n=1 Tax=Pseudonocardia sp. Ae717_Ps2 TaxID=1885573 RepID=UPI00095905FE|nr:hypothetical protein [Pseudonocardia sp. Ae717_Ps2]OLM29073.1 hypothetical protein Ae717Ps2_5829 [Pseudonocardia sp. Ae717_Ps2]
MAVMVKTRRVRPEPAALPPWWSNNAAIPLGGRRSDDDRASLESIVAVPAVEPPPELWEQVSSQTVAAGDLVDARGPAAPSSVLAPSTGELPVSLSEHRAAASDPGMPALPSWRPADDERSTQTTVDRPVEALRPIDPAEARQLAECFAMDYLSCDAEDPGRRRLALEPYLARQSDALLGWPGGVHGHGRRRAVHARAGEVLAHGYVLTVDVKALVEIFDPVPSHAGFVSMDGAAEATAAEATGAGEPQQGDPAPVPRLPVGARWSAVPPSIAEGWAPVMAVWQRLGVPIRRHDHGHLVVELQQLPSPDDDRLQSSPESGIC